MANKNAQKGNTDISEALNNSEAFFIKHKKAIIIAVVAIVVVIAAVALVHSYVLKPEQQEASTALAKGQQYMQQQNYDVALKGDGATYAGFEKIASDYSSTDAGNLANLYAAVAIAHQQKPDWKKALSYAEEFSPADDQIISPLSQMALGDIYANNNMPDKAVSSFKKAASMADDEAKEGASLSVAPIALRKAGIILESQGKKQDALEIYKQIKEKYVASPVYQDIDKYIERASN